MTNNDGSEPALVDLSRKAFRRQLNSLNNGEWKSVVSLKHRNGRFHQKTRPYGDYLWFQDRARFEANYQDWLEKNRSSL